MAQNNDFLVKNGIGVKSTATIFSVVQSTSTSTGALIVKGGAGVAGNLYVGGSLYVSTLQTTFNINAQGNQTSSIGTATGGLGGITVQGDGTNAAFMTFYRPNVWASYFGLDTDNKWKVGGWSAGAVSYEILHSGNYNSYAPTLTGTGATGTWPINITGSAASAVSTALTNTYVGVGNASNVLTGTNSLTWSGSNFYINGNIGLGVAPAAKIDALSAANSTGRIDSLQLVHSGQNSLLVSQFGQSHVSSPAVNQIAGYGVEQHVHIITDTLTNVQAGTSTVGIFLRSGGNVGIGTRTPGFKLEVNGSFAAVTKSFLIPHPTKPNMQLRYGSLEGPENGIYIRGKLKDSNTIELPEYWTKLVDPTSITVSLTSIGKHQYLYVEDISNNIVTVGNSNMLRETINCFYVVYGERCDVDKLVVEI